MNPFVRANLRLSTPTVDPLDIAPEFDGGFVVRVVVHGGDALVDRLISQTYVRGRLIQFKCQTLMVISWTSTQPSDSIGNPGGRVVTFRAVDLPTILASLVPDDGTGKPPMTFADKIIASVEPKFGVVGKRKLIL